MPSVRPLLLGSCLALIACSEELALSPSGTPDGPELIEDDQTTAQFEVTVAAAPEEAEEDGEEAPEPPEEEEDEGHDGHHELEPHEPGPGSLGGGGLGETSLDPGEWTPPGAGDDEGDAGGTDEGGADEEDSTDSPCAQNAVQFQGEDDDLPQQTLRSFVFQDDGETIWIIGYEPGDEEAACAWAADPQGAGGYELLIEVSGARTEGATKTWMDDDADDAAELRLENNGAGTTAESENGSGSMVIASYTAGETLEMASITGTLDDGSHITDASFTACYCGAMVDE